MGKLIVVIAGAHQGKSYFVKQQILNAPKSPVLVYDFQNCYGDSSTKQGDLITNLPAVKNLEEATQTARCRYYGDHVYFQKICLYRKNTIIVFEEATIFFQGRTEKDMRQIIVDRFHNGNTIFIQFHSINAVPPLYLEMSNEIILFKTGDSETTIKRKYPRLLPYFKKLQGTPDRSKIIIDMKI